MLEAFDVESLKTEQRWDIIVIFFPMKSNC